MEGQRLGGRYQLQNRIGGGGMAVVYKATDLVLNRIVAVKVLRSQFGSDEDFVQRFRREAQAVASLSHPNVVSVYDVGQEDDTYFMVMEYIEGSNLKDVINERGALPVAEAVRIALQICDALDHAHQNHIIHRDIKPQNILIGTNGRVKVTDFGIARAVTSATITHTGSVLGSVHYFSPEQARGGVTAEKSDIYSLGIVLYEMVTGQLPFSGDSPITIALKHLQEPLPEPRQINPDIPQSVENIVLKALVKDPFLRYRSAKEMMLDLETCLAPERLNEEKIRFPIDDEETKVLPAITPEMMAQYKPEHQLDRRTGDEEGESAEVKSNWWTRTLIWVGTIGLFLLLAAAGVIYLLDAIEVPEVAVPPVTGTPVATAKLKIEQAELVPNVIEDYHEEEEGTVYRQEPAPPMRLKRNSEVTLYVSKGPEEVAMPRVIGEKASMVQQQLQQDKYKEVIIKEREDPEVPAGHVIEQIPAPDTQVVPTKTAVTLYVSKGKKYVKLPEVIGKQLAEARVDLLQAGLEVGEVSEEPSYEEQDPNVVLSTYPHEPGMEVATGTKINLRVSNGKYPADARIGSYVIHVDPDGEKMDIRIVRQDARGEGVVEQTIRQPQDLTLSLVLSPEKDAKIEVFKNGVLDQTHHISYENLE
ncbi:Stk1 family PASTA domain-containing Ser/Thr kinase [Brevibacillus humidisoli]|uniref:Stk1 family PASTA domain-containing Ser/Thr kinase n=1 Tax=Brevibacillus humidisoli TaxID=2895522 RepID=UPI001E4805DC|nr:Stk1 family PASTA domain-containing Ser/Thr kinase [Brevibacillus humidisoli]UFJ41988.1 Stk1 family PASTA domain-containing Ser/Thr kinase [Brevibacillus humidisoli]